MKKLKTQSGFTLIELLVVLVIIGILTAIAVTRYQDLTTEAQIGAAKGNLAAIRGGINLLHARLILAGFSTGPAQWPTVTELNNNLMSRPGTPVDTLRIIEGPANTGGLTPPCTLCMPPDSVISNNRQVTGVTQAQADARTVVSGAGIGWDYDNNTGQLYVAATTPSDSMGVAANLW